MPAWLPGDGSDDDCRDDCCTRCRCCLLLLLVLVLPLEEPCWLLLSRCCEP